MSAFDDLILAGLADRIAERPTEARVREIMREERVDLDMAQLRLECIDRVLKAILPDDGPAQIVAAAKLIEAYLVGGDVPAAQRLTEARVREIIDEVSAAYARAMMGEFRALALHQIPPDRSAG